MNRIKFILLGILLLTGAKSMATHLVGGEIELIHLQGNRYLVRQNQYFDAHGENTQTILSTETTARVFIFSKRSHQQISSLQLIQRSHGKVPYSNPECDDATLEIIKVVYEAEITLSPNAYNDSMGYYIAWERCCRNDHITNINNPSGTGQTFYMEFPAVQKDGQPFINSSPTLFPPIGDYACRNQMFYFDFSGSDPDGDSLVYSLATPLDTHTDEAIPTQIRPAPFPLVSFKTGVGLNNMIQGSPSLAISWDGFITVRPSQTGLFVFAVKCEEFRDGIKIGEVRRDYQLLVIANCSPGSPPEIVMRKGNGPVQSGKVNVVFDKSDSERCLNINVTDLDFPENVRLLMRPLNFSGLADLIPDTTAILQNAADALDLQICFPDCPAFTNEPYKMYILALDDACTFPLIDTLHIEVSYKDFDQQPPYFTNEGNVLEITAEPGDSYQIPIQVLDDDGDTVVVSLVNSSLPLNAFNASFNFQDKSSGVWNGQFNWTYNCNNVVYDSLSEYTFTLVALDKNACLTSLSDTLHVRIKTDVEENIAPEIEALGYQENDTLYVPLGQTLNLNIKTTDFNLGNPLNLKALKDNIDFEYLGINFNDKTGSTSLNSTLNWTVPCNRINLALREVFVFTFTSEDNQNCQKNLTDTLHVIVKLIPLENEAPDITIYDLPASDTLSVLAETELIIQFDALDSPQDSVLISLTEMGSFQALQNFNLTLNKGIGEANGQIIWTPSCDLLGPRGESTTFWFDVISADKNACKQSMASEGGFFVKVYNIDEIPSYTPVNAITPNGDAFNQEFHLPNLPPDNCVNRFEYVEIVNRWGRKVFYSEDRNFRWNGEGESSGVYFYTIRFSNRTIISPIHVLY